MEESPSLPEAREALFAWHCAIRLWSVPARPLTPDVLREWEQGRQEVDRLYQLWLDASGRVVRDATEHLGRRTGLGQLRADDGVNAGGYGRAGDR